MVRCSWQQPLFGRVEFASTRLAATLLTAVLPGNCPQSDEFGYGSSGSGGGNFGAVGRSLWQRFWGLINFDSIHSAVYLIAADMVPRVTIWVGGAFLLFL